MRVRDKFFEIGMQVERFNGGLEGREQADGETDAARRLENIDPATDAGNGLGQVRRTSLQKLRPMIAQNLASKAE